MADEFAVSQSKPPLRWLSRLAIALIVPAVIATAFWGVLAWKYYGHDVNTTRNYAAEFNAPILKVPEEARAWTHYRRALMVLEPKKEAEAAIDPRDPNWPQTVAYLKRNAKGLEMVRQAANIQTLGYLVHDGDDPMDRPWQIRHQSQIAKHEARPMTDNPELFAAVDPHLEPMMSCFGLLRADAQLAIGEKDRARALRDWKGAMKMSRQLSGGNLVSHLVADTISNIVLDRVTRQLWRGDGLFTDDDLDQLALLVKRVPSTQQRLQAFAFEQAAIDDAVQRYFTDDGHGNGYCLPEGIGLKEAQERHWNFIDPIRYVLFRADRRETVAMNERIMAPFNSAMRLPPWRWDEIEESPIAEMEESNKKYAFSGQFAAAPLVARSFQLTAQLNRATQSIVAICRYKRRHHQWPASLASLVPEFLNEIPKDMFDGETLRYRLVDGNPRLYSVGTNLIDDGGVCDPALTNDVSKLPPQEETPGDWVFWPPPPTIEDNLFGEKPPRAPEPDDDAEENVAAEGVE